MHSLSPHVAALKVLGKAGIALMPWVARLLLQHLGHRTMQQHAPRAADIAVHHFAHFVVAKIIDTPFGILNEQSALHQRLHGVQKTRLRQLGQRQQRLKVEVVSEHRRQIKQRSLFSGYASQAHAHRVTQRIGQRQIFVLD